MGVIRLFSTSSFDESAYKRPNPIEPRADNYKVNQHLELGKFLILDLTYPNCTNYEGRKILVFKASYEDVVIKQKLIDPHFSNNKNYISPVARFDPKHGWSLAIFFVTSLLEVGGI